MVEQMEEGENHQDEEGEREKPDNMQGSDSERRVSEPSPNISGPAGPHGMETITEY